MAENKTEFSMGESDKPIPTSPRTEGEEAQETCDVEDDPPTDTSPTAQEDCPTPPEFSAYNLPIYIYNCPLADLSEQLVNKWTHHKAFDIYEDLQFKSDEFRPETPRGEEMNTITTTISRTNRFNDEFAVALICPICC